MPRDSGPDPALFQSCVGQKPTIEWPSKKKETQPYMQYSLEKAYISGYQVGGSGEVPTDLISLDFNKIELKYREQEQKSGGQAPKKEDWAPKKTDSDKLTQK